MEDNFSYEPIGQPKDKINLPEAPKEDSFDGVNDFSYDPIEFSIKQKEKPTTETQDKKLSLKKEAALTGAEVGLLANVVPKSLISFSRPSEEAIIRRLIESGRLQPPGMAPGASPDMPSRGAVRIAPEGTYPRATGPGSAPYNYGRAYGLPEIEAGKALTTTKEPGGVWDLLEQRRQNIKNIQQKFPTESWAENPRYGGIMTTEDRPGMRFVQEEGGLRQLPQAPAERISPLERLRSAYQRASEAYQRLSGMVPEGVSRGLGTLGRFAAKPLGGAVIGAELQDLINELQKKDPDYARAVLSGLGIGAGALSFVPAAAPIAIPVGLGVSGIQYLRDQ
jgi:hypothetical protein